MFSVIYTFFILIDKNSDRFDFNHHYGSKHTFKEFIQIAIIESSIHFFILIDKSLVITTDQNILSQSSHKSLPI